MKHIKGITVWAITVSILSTVHAQELFENKSIHIGDTYTVTQDTEVRTYPYGGELCYLIEGDQVVVQDVHGSVAITSYQKGETSDAPCEDQTLFSITTFDLQTKLGKE